MTADHLVGMSCLLPAERSPGLDVLLMGLHTFNFNYTTLTHQFNFQHHIILIHLVTTFRGHSNDT
jgi:hypothetical protein